MATKKREANLSKAQAARINGKKGGRPKGSKTKKTPEQEEALDIFQTRIRERWRDLIDAYLDIALGYYYEKPVWSNGEQVGEKIYSTDPDRKALNDLMSRVVGKIPDEILQSIDIRNTKKMQSTIQEILDDKK